MMLQTLVFICAFALWCQGSLPSSPAAAADCVTALEKKRLAAETNIDGRVKIYREISERLHQTVQTAVARQGFDELPPLVGCWQEQLAASLKDIEANINRKKKSGALINYEIQLRKSIVDMGDNKVKAPYQQQTDFESWLAQANRVHEKFVDILFQR